MATLLFYLLALPLTGALAAALAGSIIPRRATAIAACAAVGGSFVLAAAAFVTAGGNTWLVRFGDWFAVGGVTADFSVRYDPLAAVMALMVTFISLLVHLYSVGFMRDDRDAARYFCYLNLFVFAMLIVTLADSLLFFYLGWEGVGLCSYLLIGFWHRDPINTAAGRKAFTLTRIGDVALLIAFAILYAVFGNLSLTFVNERSADLNAAVLLLLGLLFLWAAAGKSAQLPLAVWLPDAMAGPTPVSALMHAATMVTAGVYLLLRFYPLLSRSPAALFAVALVGGATALWGALSALGQRDIKRVLAYSTVSQVGYMMLAVGAGDPVGSLFHLLTHACFKALLFLAAGCVIQALGGEHDIFRMGGLHRRLPIVSWMFLAGAAALGSIPPCAGFFSKERVLLALAGRPGIGFGILWLVAFVTEMLTALYIFRLIFVVFFGPAREGRSEAAGPLPRTMRWTLWPLGILALVAGALNLPAAFGGTAWLARYLSSTPGVPADLGTSPALEWGMAALVTVAALSMIRPAWRLAAAGERAIKPGGLLAMGFHLDRWYHQAIVRPYERLAAFLWHAVDERSLNGGAGAAGRSVLRLSGWMRRWTTGRLSFNLKMLFLGSTAILALLAYGWYASP